MHEGGGGGGGGMASKPMMMKLHNYSTIDTATANCKLHAESTALHFHAADKYLAGKMDPLHHARARQPCRTIFFPDSISARRPRLSFFLPYLFAPRSISRAKKSKEHEEKLG